MSIAIPATIVGARSGCRPTTSRRCVVVHLREAREQQLARRELEDVAVDPGRVVGLERELDRGALRGRPRDGDRGRRPLADVGGHGALDDRL